LDDAHPATDCTVHDARKMPPITRDNDHENSPVRNPPTLAHRGESAVANRPTFWSRSLSRPALLGFLDSGDPRCTSHTVPRMYNVNCRYSLCQFSATSTAKLAEVR
jgi:hypothetical protein